MRRAAKRDANEQEIVAALRTAGAYVCRLDRPCDLLVLFRQRWFTLEVKAKRGSTRAHQEAQRRFLELTGTPVVRTPDAALKAIGATDSYGGTE